MNKHQFRAIRNSLQRDEIYLKGTEYNNNLIDYPIMGKTINDIVIRGKKVSKSMLYIAYTLIKGKNTYKSYSIDYSHSSQTMYVITLNDKIIYWTTSSIFAPANAAWHILTEVFHGYGTDVRNGCWTWKSHEDFDCIDHFWYRLDPEFNKNWYYHTEYQKEMYKKTGKYYIDKEIVDKSIIEPLFEKEYYHT